MWKQRRAWELRWTEKKNLRNAVHPKLLERSLNNANFAGGTMDNGGKGREPTSLERR